MDRQGVTSSNLAEVGYEPASETLEVLFKNGRLYHYFNVPAFVHEQMMAAASVGGYFNANIKGQYPEAPA